MRKTILSIATLSALFLSGCLGSGFVKETSNKVNFYYNDTSNPWVIEGQFLQIGNSVQIFVNNQLAIDGKGKLTSWSGADSLEGSYNGVPMQANCTFASGSGREICDIYVEGTFAASLTWDGIGFF